MTSSATSESSTLSSGTTSRSLSISVPAVYPLLGRRRFSGARLPEGLAAIVEALAREVLRERPDDIYSFAAQHFHYLVESRTNEWSGPAPAQVQAQRKKAASSELTGGDWRRRFCSLEESRTIEKVQSPQEKNKSSKKKSSRNNDDAAGWSISETSRILNKQAVFGGSTVGQSQIEEDANHSSQDSTIPKGSRQPDEMNAPVAVPVIGRESAVGDSTNFLRVESQLISPRRGSFELVDADLLHDSQYPRKTAHPLLRSASFDCIFPRSIDQFRPSSTSDIAAVATVRSNSATSHVPPSIRPTKALKDNTNKKKQARSVFLPAVSSSSSRPSVASQSAPPFSYASCSLPAGDSSSRDHHQSEPGRMRGNNCSTSLPLLKYDLANKSAKKCNFPLVLPAVACGISGDGGGGGGSHTILSEGQQQSASAVVQGLTTDAAGRLTHNLEGSRSEEGRATAAGTTATDNEGEGSTALILSKDETTRRVEKAAAGGGGGPMSKSNDRNEDERLRMNELGEKLLALEMVERKIERRLVLAGDTHPEKLASFTRDDPREKNEEGEQHGSEEGAGLESLAQKESIKEDWPLHDDDMDKQQQATCVSADTLFGVRLTANSLQLDGADPSKQEGTATIRADVLGIRGSVDSCRIPLISTTSTNNNTINLLRAELEEIIEEAEEEISVGRADYESRVVKSIVAVNLGAGAAFGKGMPAGSAGSAANPPSAPRNDNMSCALENIAEKERKKQVRENGRFNNCLGNNSSALLEEARNGGKNPSDRRSNACGSGRVGHLTMAGAALELEAAPFTPSTPLIQQGDLAFEEEIARELIENGKSESLIVITPLDRVPYSLPQQSADTRDEKSSSLLRVCHTGEFHDSLPLPLFNEVAFSSSFISADADNIPEIQKHGPEQPEQPEYDENSAIVSNKRSASAAHSSTTTREPGASALISSNREGSCFPVEQVISLPQSSKLPLSTPEQPFPLSGAFSSIDFLSPSQFLHPPPLPPLPPITCPTNPQDQLSLCALIRPLPTNFESFISFTPYPPPSYLYISYSDLAVPADAYNIYRDSPGDGGGVGVGVSTRDANSLTIEELPNAINDLPQYHVQEMEIWPAIDYSLVASIPSPLTDGFNSLEEFHHLEENTHSNPNQ